MKGLFNNCYSLKKIILINCNLETKNEITKITTRLLPFNKILIVNFKDKFKK